jgi:hypothetical protein
MSGPTTRWGCTSCEFSLPIACESAWVHQPLNLECDIRVSKPLHFKFNLYRYDEGSLEDLVRAADLLGVSDGWVSVGGPGGQGQERQERGNGVDERGGSHGAPSSSSGGGGGGGGAGGHIPGGGSGGGGGEEDGGGGSGEAAAGDIVEDPPNPNSYSPWNLVPWKGEGSERPMFDRAEVGTAGQVLNPIQLTHGLKAPGFL